jgi:shikimate kinase
VHTAHFRCTELNQQVAEKFAEVAGYAHLDTGSIIEECIGKSVQEVEQNEGRDTVVVAEASVIEQTALHLRSSISLLGGGWGAAARFSVHSHATCFVCVQILQAALPGAASHCED